MNRPGMGVLGIGLAAAMVITSCTTRTEGPLDAGGGEGSICTPIPAEGDATIGAVVNNPSESIILLQQVSITEPEALELTGTWVVPVAPGEESAIGAGSTDPRPERQAFWDRRVKPEGFELAPGEYANVVVALSLADSVSEGTARSMTISYSVNGEEYVAETTTAMLLSETDC